LKTAARLYIAALDWLQTKCLIFLRLMGISKNKAEHFVKISMLKLGAKIS
jgi:hypothetical protein